MEKNYRHEFIETEQGQVSVAKALSILLVYYVDDLVMGLYDYASDHHDRYISECARAARKRKQMRSVGGPVASPGNLPRTSGLAITKPRTFASTVVDASKAHEVIMLLRQLMEGKTKPKDVLMPVRAAMEAGVIRRPTWEEFCQEFGSHRLKSKTSFSDYTNPDNKPYAGADFEMMKDKFRRLLTEGQ